MDPNLRRSKNKQNPFACVAVSARAALSYHYSRRKAVILISQTHQEGLNRVHYCLFSIHEKMAGASQQIRPAARLLFPAAPCRPYTRSRALHTFSGPLAGSARGQECGMSEPPCWFVSFRFFTFQSYKQRV